MLSFTHGDCWNDVVKTWLTDVSIEMDAKVDDVMKDIDTKIGSRVRESCREFLCYGSSKLIKLAWMNFPSVSRSDSANSIAW